VTVSFICEHLPFAGVLARAARHTHVCRSLPLPSALTADAIGQPQLLQQFFTNSARPYPHRFAPWRFCSQLPVEPCIVLDYRPTLAWHKASEGPTMQAAVWLGNSYACRKCASHLCRWMPIRGTWGRR